MIIKVEMRSLENLSRQFPRAAVAALNRTARSTRSFASRDIRKTYAIKKTDLDRSMTVKGADRNYMVATLTAKGDPIPIIQFKATELKSGVRVMIKKGRRVLMRHAFIARTRSMDQQVLEREEIGARRVGRLPVDVLFGPSVPQIMGSRRMFETISQFVHRKLLDEFGRAIAHMGK